MPLPYNTAALKAQYALSSLGALGLGLFTNHEGYYLGNAALAPFFEALNNTLPGGPHVCIVHPTEPLMRINNGSSIIVANPTTYVTGLVEFYFETARALMDLVLSQTLIKYTNVRWSIAHVGGAFPAIEDRFVKKSTALEKLAKQALNSRVWYDSAGPTYFAQVKGLLGYGVPSSQLVFGSVRVSVPVMVVYEHMLTCRWSRTSLTRNSPMTFLQRPSSTPISLPNWRRGHCLRPMWRLCLGCNSMGTSTDNCQFEERPASILLGRRTPLSNTYNFIATLKLLSFPVLPLC